jgi:cytochrome P450
MIKYPPTPLKRHWFFGNMLDFQKNNGLIQYLLDKKEELGDIHWIKLPMGRMIYAVSSPEYIKYVLQDHNKNYTKGFAYTIIKPLLGNGLLTNEGDFWRQQRRLIQPAFHKEKILGLNRIMEKCVDDFIHEFDQKYRSGDKVNITHEMNYLALKMVTSTLFQSDVAKEFDTINQHLNYLMYDTAKIIRRPFMGRIKRIFNLKAIRSFKELSNMVVGMIEQRRKSNQSYDDLLDMLIEAQDEDTGKGMSNQQLKDEIMTLMVAGHETSAYALTYAWYLLASNPETDQKLYKDITQNPKNMVDVAHYKEATYTKQVIQETLRLYPPAWVVSRKSIENDEIGGYFVPKGTNILISPFVMHRDARYWDNPLSFIPERFATEKVKNLPRYVYFPFGGGPRLCIGDQFALSEIQIVLTKMRQKFRFHKPEGFELKVEPVITLRPVGNVDLILEKITEV